jgi:hypothetical protein
MCFPLFKVRPAGNRRDNVRAKRTNCTDGKLNQGVAITKAKSPLINSIGTAFADGRCRIASEMDQIRKQSGARLQIPAKFRR